MKKIILALMIYPLLLFSQSKDADTLHFTYWNGSSTITNALDMSLDRFTQKHIYFGWHWSQNKLYSDFYKANFEAGGLYRWLCSSSSFTNNFNAARSNEELSAVDQSTGVYQSQSIQYDARLHINCSSDTAIDINQQSIIDSLHDNPLQSIFGFRTVKGDTLGDYRIFDVNDTGLVLGHNWPSNRLEHSEFGDGLEITDDDLTKHKENIPIKRMVNGEHFFLSANLGRLNPGDIIQDTATVLRIKVRYTDENGGTGCIRFAGLPSPTATTFSNIQNSRTWLLESNRYMGRSRSPDILSDDTVFIINRNMLPKGSDSDRDVTISAYITLVEDKEPNVPFNHFLQNASYTFTMLPKIKSMVIEVYHPYNNTSLRCRWIRFETPQTRNLLRGMFDDSIQHCYQRDLTFFDDISYRNINFNIFRFFGRDEMKIFDWHAERYIKKLLGGMLTTTTKSDYPYLYKYHVNDAIQGMFIPTHSSFVPQPYIRRGWWEKDSLHHYTTNPAWLGISSGFYGAAFDEGHYRYYQGDSLKSNYETQIIDGDNLISPDSLSKCSLSHYLDVLKNNESNQCKYENMLYWATIINPGGEFLGVSNWAYYCYTPGWNLHHEDGDANTYINCRTPYTGEAFRMTLFEPILHGAKVISIDRLIHTYDCFIDLNGGQIGIINHTPSSAITETINYSDDFGGDFLHQDNYFFENLDNIITTGIRDSINKVHKIGDPNRIYTGQRSNRVELKHIKDWIDVNDSVLMRLRLVSFFDKGYKIWRLTDPAFPQDIFNRFIKLDTSYLPADSNNRPNTRKIGYSQIESSDSSFYLLTCLRDSSVHNFGNGADTSAWYLGVLNKRTDPLIKLGNPNNPYLQFFSTAEFEDSCGISPDPTRWSKDTTIWREKAWSRLGARTLEIPLNYTDSSGIANILIKVTEFGKGTSLDTMKWRNPLYYHAIDTIIDGKGKIIIDLQPGEGKILKCQIIRDKPNIDGSLDNSNQRKICAWPANYEDINGVTNYDTVRYHSVYHKKDKNGYKVYYRRSYPMDRSVPEYDINWEPEYCISSYVTVNDSDFCIPQRSLSTISCGFPSIVVRYDNESRAAIAYIVYTADCAYDPMLGDTTALYIAENKIIANSQNVTILGSNVIGITHASYDRNLARWGTPSINASGLNLNFYTWSDSINGIVVGYKYSNETCLRDTHQVHWFPKPTREASLFCRFPSLNTYSRIREDEDDCALVWSENPPGNYGDDTSHVFFTRIRRDSYNNMKIYNYVPKDTGYIFSALYNLDTSIIRLSAYPTNMFAKKNLYPTVYRGLEEWSAGHPEHCCDILAEHYDRVFWQGKDTYLNRDIVFFTGIETLDTLSNNEWVPNIIVAHGNYSFISMSRLLYSPTAAQGVMTKITNGGSSYYSSWGDSIIVVNFAGTAGGNSYIWNINHGYWSLMNDWPILVTGFENYKYAKIVSFGGYMPQLCALPNIINDKPWSFNRRIFNYGTNNPPNIASSLMFFFKRNTDEDMPYPFFGFQDNKGRTMFSPAWTDDDNFTELPKINLLKKENIGFSIKDTIYSDWFSISSLKNLSFFGYTAGNQNKADMFIQRQSDSKRFNITLQTEDSTKSFRNYKFKLINGGDEKYRLVWKKKNANYYYTEQLFLDGLPSITDLKDSIDRRRFGKVSAESESIIDLGEATYQSEGNGISLSIFPNPTEKEIFAKALLPISKVIPNEMRNPETITDNSDLRAIGSTRFKYVLYSTVGQKLKEIEAKAGETVVFDVSGLTQGVYFIRAEADNEINSSTSKSFVIEK